MTFTGNHMAPKHLIVLRGIDGVVLLRSALLIIGSRFFCLGALPTARRVMKAHIGRSVAIVRP